MNRLILILCLIVFLPLSFSNDMVVNKDRSFLEIYKADEKRQMENLTGTNKESCIKDRVKCSEQVLNARLQAMMFGNKSKPDPVKEWQILCYKCCLGEVSEEDCNDFKESWGTKQNCKCEKGQ